MSACNDRRPGPVDLDGGANNWWTLKHHHGTRSGRRSAICPAGRSPTFRSIPQPRARRSRPFPRTATSCCSRGRAAGLAAMPAAAQGPIVADDGHGFMGSASITGSGIANPGSRLVSFARLWRARSGNRWMEAPRSLSLNVSGMTPCLCPSQCPARRRRGAHGRSRSPLVPAVTRRVPRSVIRRWLPRSVVIRRTSPRHQTP